MIHDSGTHETLKVWLCFAATGGSAAVGWLASIQPALNAAVAVVTILSGVLACAYTIKRYRKL